MLTHSQIWAAIDALATREGLSPSSLARQAGLDPTTFNRSKRQNSEGQLRWPSTESIAKVLAATGASIDEFLLPITARPASGRRVPFRVLTGLADEWFDKEGRPAATGWDEIAFPGETDLSAFALEIRGDRFAPIYRDGDLIIVSPVAQPRRGDRVIVLDAAGQISFEVLGHQTLTHVHFTTLTGAPVTPRPLGYIRIVNRIVWASQ